MVFGGPLSRLAHKPMQPIAPVHPSQSEPDFQYFVRKWLTKDSRVCPLVFSLSLVYV